MEYRVEKKYLISDLQIVSLISRLEQYIAYDSHTDRSSYLIRSLYFDDNIDSCLLENEMGIDNREKFRIRTYNNDSSRISLEMKSKRHGYTHKESEIISKEECLTYMSGRIPPLKKENGFLMKKLYAKAMTTQFMPVEIVEYERTAFVEPNGNVRITFDRNISGSRKIDAFFDESIPLIPVLPSNQHILEVKYDELLPDYLSQILDTGELAQTSYSKYYYARVNEKWI